MVQVLAAMDESQEADISLRRLAYPFSHGAADGNTTISEEEQVHELSQVLPFIGYDTASEQIKLGCTPMDTK
jgi:hypothetical protein